MLENAELADKRTWFDFGQSLIPVGAEVGLRLLLCPGHQRRHLLEVLLRLLEVARRDAPKLDPRAEVHLRGELAVPESQEQRDAALLMLQRQIDSPGSRGHNWA